MSRQPLIFLARVGDVIMTLGFGERKWERERVPQTKVQKSQPKKLNPLRNREREKVPQTIKLNRLRNKEKNIRH